ncbi:D-glycerate dehydrogenase [Ensifer sp. ENS09]|uniref:2-hydroxyacid dehydrogenase n=1 Tax=Ensifer sp. ENS09 TaxID=2769263 RepID=UPI00177CD6BC|nr:D-glycerate dehydrogenase [Ensifer sp. ENS09]MBD9650084.1 D-glycerate dehydrogenase [Ensifer sp. ENS09]
MQPSAFIYSWLPETVRDSIPADIIVDHHDSSEAAMSPSDFGRRLSGKQGAVVNGMGVSRQMMEAAGPSLKVIANVGVGYDNIDVGAASKLGIVVTNTPDILTEATADMGFALLLASARRIAEADRYIRDGLYTKNQFKLLWGAEISGRTIGIIGMGRIGQAVAQRARGFNMRVVYNNRKPVDPAIEHSLQATWLPLDDVFRTADFLVLCVPLSSETRHTGNARTLALMKPKAHLINIARGPVVDELALIDALRNRTIAGAGLDVFEQEPKLAQGLADIPNVVLTPHIGSGTVEARTGMVELAVRNVVDVLKGGSATTPVNGR